MLSHHVYVNEKLRELRELKFKSGPRLTEERPGKHKPVVGVIARKAGRALRRIGEGLESWGSPLTPKRAAPAQHRNTTYSSGE